MSVNRSQQFLGALRERRYDFFTGVPCSLLKGVFRMLEEDTSFGFVPATREDSALGLAAGAYLGGKKPVVLMQNSGLGVSVNALGSLHWSYEIPTLMVVSWRGQGGKDAPEHILMGEVNEDLFGLIKVPHRVLDPERIDEQVAEIDDLIMKTKQPAALLVPKGIL